MYAKNVIQIQIMNIFLIITMGYEKVCKMLKAEINNIPLKFKTKELFEHNWNVISKK